MYSTLLQPMGSVAGVADQDAAIKLQNGMQTIRLMLTLFATLTIATNPAANLIGRGSLAQAVQIGLTDGGADRIRAEGRSMRFAAEFFAPRPLTEVRQTALAVGAYPLMCQFPIHFASPYAVNPLETTFLEYDPNADLNFVIRQKSPTPATHLVIAGGGGTAVLGAITARIIQVTTPNRDTLPYFIPTVREIVSAVVAGPSTEFRFDIDAKLNRIRAILLTQESSLGTVNDIIAGGGVANVGGIAFKGDNDRLIDPAINIDQFAEAQETESGGNVYPAADVGALSPQAGAQIMLHYQQNGRLSKILDPRQFVNLRFVLNVTPTLAAGALGSKLRATLFEMERPTDRGQRKMVAPLPVALM